MDFAKIIKQAIRIYKLDKNTIFEVASSKESTKNAIIIVVLGSFLNGIVSGSIISILISPFIQLLGLVISAGFYHLLAHLFKGKGEFMQFFRVSGYLWIANWVAIIPIIGPIILFLLVLWSIIVTIVILKIIYGLSTLKAVIIELIPLIIFGGISLLILGITLL